MQTSLTKRLMTAGLALGLSVGALTACSSGSSSTASDTSTDTTTTDTSAADTTAADTAAADGSTTDSAAAEPAGTKLDANTATQEELMSAFQGANIADAQAIVDDIVQSRPFVDMNAMHDKLKDDLAIDDTTWAEIEKLVEIPTPGS